MRFMIAPGGPGRQLENARPPRPGRPKDRGKKCRYRENIQGISREFGGMRETLLTLALLVTGCDVSLSLSSRSASDANEPAKTCPAKGAATLTGFGIRNGADAQAGDFPYVGMLYSEQTQTD